MSANIIGKVILINSCNKFSCFCLLKQYRVRKCACLYVGMWEWNATIPVILPCQ